MKRDSKEIMKQCYQDASTEEYKRDEELIENETHKIIIDINERFKGYISEIYLIMSKLTIEYYIVKLNECSNKVEYQKIQGFIRHILDLLLHSPIKADGTDVLKLGVVDNLKSDVMSVIKAWLRCSNIIHYEIEQSIIYEASMLQKESAKTESKNLR